MRRIAQRRQAPVQDSLSRALDALNAVGILEDLLALPLPGILCYGPRVCRGENWLGSLIWHRPHDYYGYKTLTLVGIWAQPKGDFTDILLGQRRLAFAVPGYNPESYHKIIRTRFDIYYNDDGRPPSEALYTMRYDSNARLDQRARLQKLARQIMQAG